MIGAARRWSRAGALCLCAAVSAGCEGGSDDAPDGALRFAQVQDGLLLSLDPGGGPLRRASLSPGYAERWPSSTGPWHVGVQPLSGSTVVKAGRCVASEARGLGPCALVYRDGRAGAELLFGGEALAAPRVSPDGRLVALRVRHDASPSLQLFSSAGLDLGRYPSDARDVRWLPDGRLAMLAGDGRSIAFSEPVPTDREPTGLAVERRITLTADDGGRAFAMDLSPDARTLAYTWVVNAGGTVRRGEVRLLDLDATSIRLAATTPDFVAGDLVSGELRRYNLWTVGWRPDGRAVFVGIGGSSRTVGAGGSGTLLEIATTGTDVRRLETADDDLRDGLQYPVSDGVRPLAHDGYPAAPEEDVSPLPSGLWPYTDYQWVGG